MSGYDKSPDYGGPEPGWPEIIFWAVAVTAAAFALAWWLY